MFNLMKTAILMAAITALFIVIGGMLGGHEGMVLALLFALAMNFFSYWFSDKMVLRMTNAQEVDQNSAPQFYELVKELAAKAELPMPKVYLINEDSPNAFATGRNPEHAAVAATTGILRILSNRELRGVMAHELAHVKHRDILISTIAATMAGAISALAREYEADRGGAEIAQDPEALASALDKIHRYASGIPFDAVEHHPETAQMMIMNPLTASGLSQLFSTHPATADRVARLMEMARTGSYPG